MKKHIIFCWLIYIFFNSLNAQQKATFEYTLHFEDAMGNIDSVIIGYDRTAALSRRGEDCFDPQFGEVKMNGPFNSEFEVRASHSAFKSLERGSCNYFSKKIIAWVEPGGIRQCTSGGKFIFWMTNMYPPVTISWNKDDFLTNECITNSFFLYGIQDELVNGWYGFNSRYHCLAETNEIEMWLGEEYSDPNKFESQFMYRTIVEIEGKGKDTIYGFALRLLAAESLRGYERNPCIHIYPTANNDINDGTNISISPNPVFDFLNISFEEDYLLSANIVDLEGRFIRQYAKIKDNKLDVSILPVGIYILNIKTESGKLIVKKFCKM